MEPLNTIKTESEKIEKEVRERSIGYIAGGLGIVVGLAWNEAIKGLIDYVMPATGAQTLFAKFGYAIILTIAVVVLTTYLLRSPEKKEGNN